MTARERQSFLLVFILCELEKVNDYLSSFVEIPHKRVLIWKKAKGPGSDITKNLHRVKFDAAKAYTLDQDKTTV